MRILNHVQHVIKKVIDFRDYHVYRGISILSYNSAKGTAQAHKISSSHFEHKSFKTLYDARIYIDSQV